VAVNCAALPESLIESEIFGHERGAFTGATDRRPGCFELADGGTLLLDEIAEMNTQLQAKLLRILQDSTFRRVGGKEEIRVDVRVIAATNRTPEEALASGKLRQDLFFRLNVFAISLPPLRERPEDIVPLARVFCEEFNRDHGREVVGFTPEAQATLLRYHWPGNVRELRNALQRAVALAGGPLISEEELMPALLLDQRSSVATSAPATGRIRDMERQLIAATLERVHHDKTRAAVELGISLKTLYNKIAKYKIGSGQPAKRDR
jgi:transcriptional regulator with PAS, ATPase and Fis domain